MSLSTPTDRAYGHYGKNESTYMHTCLLDTLFSRRGEVRICRSSVGLGVIHHDFPPELVFWHTQKGFKIGAHSVDEIG
jgi:hypothetical protein